MTDPNAKMLTVIFNQAYEKFGAEFNKIVQSNCPNLTICYDCRIDDFTHFEGCELVEGNSSNVFGGD